MPHVFLSDAWLDEVKKLAEGAEAPAGPSDLKLNFTITGGPEGDKDLHVAGGMSAAAFGKGHLADAPTKIIVPFDVAKQMLVDGNQQAAMQAFMQGQIKVEGDMSRLMAMQGAGGAPTPAQQEVQNKIKEMTA
jgi:hypothetical protein